MRKNTEFYGTSMPWEQKMLRNTYKTIGKYEIPLLHKIEIDVSNISLISADDIRTNASKKDIAKSVHFFLYDYKFEKFYTNPDLFLRRLAQYAHVLTPDFSLYTGMPLAIQIHSTFKNRWCGAHWQRYGLSVIPSVSWSTSDSFDFCYDGIEVGSVVAISTIGVRRNENSFMEGYFEMKNRIKPKQVICFGKPFNHMGDNVIPIDYLETSGRRK